MRLSDVDFALPDELVAQEPSAVRGESRLLVLTRSTGAVEHRRFADVADHLHAGDLLVLNNTKVFPARLLGRRVPSGGAVEALLIRHSPQPEVQSPTPGAVIWEALMHPGQKLNVGARVVFERDGVRLHGEILGRHFHGRRTIRLWSEDGLDVDAAIDRIGHVPLPPYIKRGDEPSDRDRYQTVYARDRGSVAAPTAGLHFTAELLDALASRGIERTEVTLHVGYGTFKPIRVERLEDHVVDPETFIVGPDAAEALTRARRGGRRIIAVGTTTVRVLESLTMDEGGRVAPQRGETDLFIRPGHPFRLVAGLITNFHLPRSSLLVLVAAFAGRERILAAYREAVARGYRFYSYGDAMLIL
ncbi:MAG: tRNA preQ1(34) S-adenosylmethionine ribosyltransferase-isomerase QueA [Acidobacteria bacterium]|nr:tRNA preQ1(34) S-adenosylmethionine ribosyltransferase-isomerase QueA [Acidobacteriota bacterium]